MKILLVDNYSSCIKQLIGELSKNQITKVPFGKVSLKYLKETDCIILSGGHKLTVKNHDKEYAKELELIKNISVPVLGICLGFQLICHAHGEELEKNENYRKWHPEN